MQPENNWQRQTLELAGWVVHLLSHSAEGRYFAEVEAVASGETVAHAEHFIRQDAENEALDKALVRLRSTKRMNVDLMVGG